MTKANELSSISKVFLEAKDISISYTEFANLTASMADYINENFQKVEKIAILIDSQIDFIPIFFAIIKSGRIAVALNSRLSQSNLLSQMNSINCNTIVVDSKYDSYFSNAEFCMLELENIKINAKKFENDAEFGLNYFDDFDLDKSATIIFTSGTSANSKAVLHKLSAHIYSAIGSNEHIALNSNDKWLLSLPLYHVGGIAILFRCIMANACVVISENQGNPLESIIKYKITHTSLVPTQLYRIIESIENDKSDSIEIKNSLKAILIGGAACQSSLKAKAKALNLNVYYSYGSSEMSSQICTTNIDSPFESSGKVLNYREIKISEDGEILCKGETLFESYIIDNQLVKPCDSEGYFHSNDIGEINENGELLVKGRKDNMFISGGENIYPEEIEQAIAEITAIDFAVVVAVNNEEFGKRPIAFINWKDDSFKMSPAEIVAILKSKIASFKIPDAFYPIPDNYSQSGIKINRMFFINESTSNAFISK